MRMQTDYFTRPIGGRAVNKIFATNGYYLAAALRPEENRASRDLSPGLYSTAFPLNASDIPKRRRCNKRISLERVQISADGRSRLSEMFR